MIQKLRTVKYKLDIATFSYIARYNLRIVRQVAMTSFIFHPVAETDCHNNAITCISFIKPVFSQHK